MPTNVRDAMRVAVGGMLEFASALGEPELCAACQNLLDVLEAPGPVTRRTALALTMDLDERMAASLEAESHRVPRAHGERMRGWAANARREAADKRSLLSRMRRSSS